MTAYITYQFDPQTGFIGSIVRSDWPDDHEFLKTPNFVVTTKDIPAIMTTTHADGTVETINTIVQNRWSFQLDENGVPRIDGSGNYLVTPPAYDVSTPNAFTHIFSMLVELTKRPSEAFDPKTLNDINWSLDSVGLPPVLGSNLIAKPIKIGVVVSSDMAVKTLGVHAKKG